jgi:hypothetical protein
MQDFSSYRTDTPIALLPTITKPSLSKPNFAKPNVTPQVSSAQNTPDEEVETVSQFIRRKLAELAVKHPAPDLPEAHVLSSGSIVFEDWI